MKKTVIYAGLFMLPDDDAAAHRVNTVGQMLNCLGYKSVFVGLARSPESLSESNTDTVRYVAQRAPRGGKDWISSLTDASLLLKTIEKCRDAAAVILYNYPSIPFGKVRRLCKKKNIPLLADCTEWYHSEKGNNLASLKNLETWKRMHRDYKKLDGLIVISKYLKKHYEGRYPIMILPPVIDCVTASNSEISVSREKHLELIYPGIPFHKDDIKVMLKGILGLAEDERGHIRFHLTGLKESALRDYLREDGGILDELSDVLIFHGRLPYDELLSLYGKVDFLYMSRPSCRVTKANFPSKVPELMTKGIVPICNKVGDYVTYLENGKNALIFAGTTPEDCTAVLRRALRLSEKQILSMKQEARKCALKRFDYRAWTEKLRKFIGQLAEKK